MAQPMIRETAISESQYNGLNILGMVNYNNNSSVVKIGNSILKNHHYITLRDTKDMYYYDSRSGIYLPNGETYLDEEITKYLKANFQSIKLSEVKKYVQTKTYQLRTNIGTPKGKLTLLNGILDIKNRIISPHSYNNITLSCLPIKFNRSAKCPLFLNFLQQIMSPQEADILQEYIGYCLQRGYEYKKALLLRGPPNTGKTTLLRILITFLGKENISSISLNDLETRFSIAELFGKMANICDELSAEDMKKTNQFKGLTGSSQLKAENKFKDPFTFTNEAKLIFATNQTPKAPNPMDDAFFERWQVIKMVNQFNGANADPHLFEKITTPNELSGILNWVLDGLDRLNKRGRFIDLPSLIEVKAEFGCIDSVALFVQDKVTFDPIAVTPKQTLFLAYTSNCGNRGLSAESYGEFCKRICHLNGVSVYRSGGKTRVEAFRGIRL